METRLKRIGKYSQDNTGFDMNTGLHIAPSYRFQRLPLFHSVFHLHTQNNDMMCYVDNHCSILWIKNAIRFLNQTRSVSVNLHILPNTNGGNCEQFSGATIL